MAVTDNKIRNLLDEISIRHHRVQSYLLEKRNRLTFSHQHLNDAVLSYIMAGGKSLRAAILMFACGAVGGDENATLPAAAAVELYHTFTLVHDDIIDRDLTRRGVPTIHTDFAQRAKAEYGFSEANAEHYGLTIAILAGDLQQGWAASLLPDLHFTYNVSPILALFLGQQLFRETQVALINGETLDVIQAETPVDKLDEKAVLDMLWQKTGILYQFTGKAGAAIGLNNPDFRHPMIEAVGNFTGQCGIAFQLQDDILGIVGDEKRTGKSVGADIREGKRTVTLLHSLKHMTAAERAHTLNVLGNPSASASEIERVVDILASRGGISYTRQLAQDFVAEGLGHLANLPDSHYRQLMEAWAEFITSRDR
jgi:geranylgeranyl diphosphate synthase, type I